MKRGLRKTNRWLDALDSNYWELELNVWNEEQIQNGVACPRLWLLYELHTKLAGKPPS